MAKVSMALPDLMASADFACGLRLRSVVEWARLKLQAPWPSVRHALRPGHHLPPVTRGPWGVNYEAYHVYADRLNSALS